MNDSTCTRLDDYLVGELPSDREVEFETHLHDCEACRQAVEDWRALRGLLQKAARNEHPPERLQRRIERGVANRADRQRRRLHLTALFAVTTACLLFAIIFRPPEQPLSDHEETKNQTSSNRQSRSIDPPATVELPDDVIGVPIDIADPNVTVVWVYPVEHTDMDLN